MDIKALKAQRRVLMTAFTVTLKKLKSEIQGDAIDLKNISLLQTHLKDKYLRLETVQESVSGVLLQKDDDGTEYEADFSEAEKYREDYLKSCLPEEILLTWERTRNHQHSENVTEKNSRTLTNLMTFLRQEVQGEEMVVLARSGFTMQHGTRKKEFNPVPQKENSVDSATAASLVSLKPSGKKPMCIFCDKPHASHKCFCAKRLSLDERLKILSKKGACYTHVKLNQIISVVSVI
ncbi:DUF1758 domain-containing protein [Trichonephila inaurata madagascariensis]|uniref:DUF1758 domain-containing protein n=1 Tax=Trichonephila inaurata madagascariensis TaxID=2747483 RepID=A0A8X6XEV4_9ARAC|nr:DUF1758 domain-containing protein [Trichonephila inaurata madagascariensis]